MRKKDGVYQRQEKNEVTHITATSEVPLRRTESKKDCINEAIPEKIRFEISAMPDDWWQIYLIGLNSPEYLGRLVFQHFAKTVYEEKLAKLNNPSPRGWQARFGHNQYKLNDRELWVHEARNYVAAAYTVISYWAKRPIEEWPSDFRALIDMLEDDRYDLKTHKNREYDVMNIVVELFIDKYSKDLEEYGPYALKNHNEKDQEDEITQEDYDNFISDSSNYNENSIRKIYLKEPYLTAARGLFRQENHNLSIEELVERMR